jgi:hypothetical protein
VRNVIELFEFGDILESEWATTTVTGIGSTGVSLSVPQ